jgi:hypothetical protein
MTDGPLSGAFGLCRGRGNRRLRTGGGETGRFAEQARAVLAALDAAENEATGQSGVPTGHLTLSASMTMARALPAPILQDFLKAHPRVTAKLLLLDRIVNLIDEGVDVALRVGHLPDSSLMAMKIGDVKQILFASPAYLARRGAARAPNDLKLQSIIAFPGLVPDREWRYGDGKRLKRVALQPRLEINDAASAIAGAEKGRGRRHPPVLYGGGQDRARRACRSSPGRCAGAHSRAAGLPGKAPHRAETARLPRFFRAASANGGGRTRAAQGAGEEKHDAPRATNGLIRAAHRLAKRPDLVYRRIMNSGSDAAGSAPGAGGERINGCSET